MKKNVLITLLAALLLSSCGEYNKLLKSTDYEYKYEAAKNYFAKGQYSRAATLLNELIAILKGTDKAEESLYMLGMSYYNQKDYQTAAQTFTQYYNVYPRGTFTELARFHAGKALFLDTPEPRLDQSGTYSAIQQLQMFLEYFPDSSKKDEAQSMIFALQDKLVMKEYLSAKLYYNLGNYLGNNYESCVITAQNALKDYPYTNMREDLSILILRAKYEMAVYSVEDKRAERYREAVDEYYAFKNEFPERTEAMCLFSTAALSERTVGALRSKYKNAAPIVLKAMETVPYSIVRSFEMKQSMGHVEGASAEEAYYMRDMFNDIYSGYTSEFDVHMTRLVADVINRQPCTADKFAYLDGRVLLVLPEDDGFFDRDMQNDLMEMMPSPMIGHVSGGHAATLMRVGDYIKYVDEFMEKLD